MRHYFFFSLIAVVIACGDGTPFDEDYWDSIDGDSRAEESDSNNGRFSVILNPLTGVGFTHGSASIDLNGNEAILTVRMEGVPGNIIQGNITTIGSSCESIISNPPTTGTMETRNWTFTENGTRGALFDDFQLGENIETRSLVIYAFSTASGMAGASQLFPFACGAITRPSSDEGAGPDAPSGTAGATGGVNGGTTGGLVGGVTGEATGGIAGGIDGGVAGEVAGGVTGGEVPTTVGGGTVGGVGGTPGGVTTTGGIGTNTGGVGGTPGGVTTTGGLGGSFSF